MFNDDLKQARTRLGISGREAAKRIGISSAYYSQLETGKREKPKGELLAKIETVLQASLDKSSPLAVASDSANACKRCAERLSDLEARMGRLESLLLSILERLSQRPAPAPSSPG